MGASAGYLYLSNIEGHTCTRAEGQEGQEGQGGEAEMFGGWTIGGMCH